MKNSLKLRLGALLLAAFTMYSCSSLSVSTDTIKVDFNKSGVMESITLIDKNLEIPIVGGWSPDSCRLIESKASKKGDVICIDKVWSYQNREFSTSEQITEKGGNIKWNFSVVDVSSGLWSTPISTTFKYPETSDTRYWSAWSDPRQGKILDLSREQQIAQGIIPDAMVVNDWADPLIAIPFQNAKLWYGEEPYSLDLKWRMFGVRNDEKYITVVPMITVVEPQKGVGVSFVQSIDEILLNVNIETTESGDIIFKRENYRLGDGVTQSFTMDIIAHSDDFLDGFNEITKIYPEYFEPSDKGARDIEGLFSYSRDWGNFDKEKMRKMGYKTNWKASHDLPWMGMFLPPVEDQVRWKGFERQKGTEDDWVSISKMRDYTNQMVEDGFKVLNYMNVCEFGAYVPNEAPKGINDIPEDELWKDGKAYVYRKLNDAILRRTFRNPTADSPNKFYSWRQCIALDCGIPSYRDYLVEQVKRHIGEFPTSSGFNVDRLDWLRLYNLDADDGISYWENQAVRSLNVSYKELMEILWPMLKDNGKYWFLDPNGVRIDFMNRADGIIEEIEQGQVLNCASFMAPKKPIAAWMHIKSMEGKSDEEREVWLQNYLVMGIWPMAPFPENDHSLLPDEGIEKVYSDYSNLFKTIYGRENVLSSKAIKRNTNAKVNLFKSDLGYIIPICYAKKGLNKVIVEVKKEYVENRTAEVVLPAVEGTKKVEYTINGDYALFEVPVSRRCAVLVLKN
ncbi:MAG: hypothetical protein R3Y50_03080 [Rikenellaceae bacterium]